ncbi:TetR/AcrR family transcriptional regulator C-terminal ligand-binding domain-containing protein [Sorangium sp. So ce118]
MIDPHGRRHDIAFKGSSRTPFSRGGDDPALAERLRKDYLSRQHARDRLPLTRAVERGDLPAGTDVDAALDRLLGPVFYRVLVTGEALPRAYTDTLVDAVLGAVPTR